MPEAIRAQLGELAKRPVVSLSPISKQMLLLVPKIHSAPAARRFAASAAVVSAAVSTAIALTGCPDAKQPASAPTAQQPVAQSTPAPAAATPIPPIDTCSLLTSEEISAVQGEAPTDTKASQHSGQGLGIYDCFITLPTFTNSISLSVTQNGAGPDARDARESWRQTFAAAAAKASEKEPPPQRVEGIGDEAYWTGNDRMGALYVLKGSRYLRISVGGPGDQAAKIQKCRTLAEAALGKL